MTRRLGRSAAARMGLAALGGLILLAPAFAASGIRGVPAEGVETFRVTMAVRLRAGPGTQHPIVTLIPAGSASITIFACNGGSPAWCEGRWRGYRGWISSCCVVGETTGRPPE